LETQISTSSVPRGIVTAARIVHTATVNDAMKSTLMLPKHETRLARTIEELEALFKKLLPVDTEVKRMARRNALVTFSQSAKHASYCDAIWCGCCILDRKPSQIAVAVFSHTIASICEDREYDGTVLGNHAKTLKARATRCCSGMVAATLVPSVARLTAPTFDACAVCEAPFVRVDSSCSVDGEGSPRPKAQSPIALRDAINTEFAATTNMLPASRALAISLLSNSDAMPTIRDAVSSIANASDDVFAFLLLSACERAKLNALPSFARPGVGIDVGRCHKLKLDLVEAEAVIQTIQRSIPPISLPDQENELA
jgi:hypothetical protein